MQIDSKEKVIQHFKNGIKKDQFIGVENEKFLFNKSDNTRASYSKIKQAKTFELRTFLYQNLLPSHDSKRAFCAEF